MPATRARSPSLFVGGEFTSVNGIARRGLVALDPVDGTINSAFTATISGTTTPVVMDLERVGNQLYLAGSFSQVENATQGSVSRARVARLYERSGHADGYRPTVVGGKVFDLEVSPDGERVYLGGAFTAVNQQIDTRYFAGLSANNHGELLTGFDGGIDRTNLPITGQPAYVFGIAATDTKVWIATESHFLQQLDGSSGQRLHAYITCNSLDAGQTYVYRIRPVSAAGAVGPWSSPIEVVTNA